ncbi:MAG TPA: VOC family protein [Burkholderiales bacterium]|nr:VOC family protein [Burkholderiales bacterium]
MDVLVNLDVDDLEKAVRFYSAAFDLKVGRRFGTSAVELLGMTTPFYLLVQKTGTAATAAGHPRTYERHWTPVHLDFVVDDIDAAVERALAAGAKVEKPAAIHSYGKLAVLADPFGHGFCFIQFLGRGYDEIADRK